MQKAAYLLGKRYHESGWRFDVEVEAVHDGAAEGAPGSLRVGPEQIPEVLRRRHSIGVGPKPAFGIRGPADRKEDGFAVGRLALFYVFPEDSG